MIGYDVRVEWTAQLARISRLDRCREYVHYAGRACKVYCDCCERSVCRCSSGTDARAGYWNPVDAKGDSAERPRADVLICGPCFDNRSVSPHGCTLCFAQMQRTCADERKSIRELMQWCYHRGAMPRDLTILVFHYAVDDCVWRLFAPQVRAWRVRRSESVARRTRRKISQTSKSSWPQVKKMKSCGIACANCASHGHRLALSQRQDNAHQLYAVGHHADGRRSHASGPQ